MPPKFSLQPVLDFRHRRVESLEIELGRLLREKKRAEEKLNGLFKRQYELLEEIRFEQEGNLDLQHIRQLHNGLRVLQNRIKEQKNIISKLILAVSNKRAEVVKARQDEETLEILKDKEEDRFLQEENRQEQALQDDIYIAQAYHKVQDEARN